MSVELRWNGLEAKKSIEMQIQKALEEGAILVRAKAVPLAPIISGNLRRSIAISTNLKAGSFKDESTDREVTLRSKKNTAIVGTIVKYAEKIERKRSYLGSGFEAVQAKIKTLFFTLLKESEFIQ